jgi:tRNA-dihydrouridine synthase B
MREHYSRVEELYGGDRAPQLMRKFLARYAALHPDYPQVRAALVRLRGRAEWESALQVWYAQDRPGQYPDLSIHRVQGDCG